MRRRVLITCEHGGNRIPTRYQHLFVGHERLLSSHRGYDCGALWLARRLAAALKAPLYAATTSRLLVDLNRSLHNPRVFSNLTRELCRNDLDEIVTIHYLPHRNRIEQHIRKLTRRATLVAHLAVHSFTPRLAGRTRNADIGLLYDPQRPREREFCLRWQRAVRSAGPHLRIRRNYPYRGSDDGLTRHLRGVFPHEFYLGIELEINQRHVTDANTVGHGIPRALVHGLKSTVAAGR